MKRKFADKVIDGIISVGTVGAVTLGLIVFAYEIFGPEHSWFTRIGVGITAVLVFLIGYYSEGEAE